MRKLELPISLPITLRVSLLQTSIIQQQQIYTAAVYLVKMRAVVVRTSAAAYYIIHLSHMELVESL